MGNFYVFSLRHWRPFLLKTRFQLGPYTNVDAKLCKATSAGGGGMQAITQYYKDYGDFIHTCVELAVGALLALALVHLADSLAIWDQVLPPAQGGVFALLFGPEPRTGIDPLLWWLLVGFVTFGAAAILSLWPKPLLWAFYCAIAVAFGAVAGIVVRNWLVSGAVAIESASAVVALALLLGTGLWLWWQIFPPRWSLPKYVIDGAVTVAAAFVIASSLASSVAGEWNKYVTWLSIIPAAVETCAPVCESESGATDSQASSNKSNDANSRDLLQDLQELANKVDNLIGLLTVILATAAAAYVAAVATPKLQEILSYLQLEPEQVEAGHRLRRPLSDLIRKVEADDMKFKREFIVTADSFARESPIESVVHGGARIKIIAPPPGSPQNSFTFAKLRKILEAAQVDLRRSLILVYPSAGTTVDPVCYGTGAEMWELMYRIESEGSAQEQGLDQTPGSGRFRGAYSDSFFGALNSGNARAIAAVIENARASVLKENPQDDVLLSSFVLRDTEELVVAMTEMKKRSLRRALVYGGKVPGERAILSVPHIADYLWDDAKT